MEQSTEVMFLRFANFVLFLHLLQEIDTFFFLRNGRQEKAGKNIFQIYLALVLIGESFTLTDLLIIGL
jgi:hypothetical protein